MTRFSKYIYISPFIRSTNILQAKEHYICQLNIAQISWHVAKTSSTGGPLSPDNGNGPSEDTKNKITEKHKHVTTKYDHFTDFKNKLFHHMVVFALSEKLNRHKEQVMDKLIRSLSKHLNMQSFCMHHWSSLLVKRISGSQSALLAQDRYM